MPSSVNSKTKIISLSEVATKSSLTAIITGPSLLPQSFSEVLALMSQLLTRPDSSDVIT